MRRLFRLFPIAAFASAAACDDTTPAGRTDSTAPVDGEPGGTVVIASAGEPDVLLMPFSSTGGGHMISDMVFDRLASVGDDMNTIGDAGFTPQLAERWEWSADSLSIAFTLHAGARFHDGRPVQASDVAFSHALAADTASGSGVASLLGNVDSVQARDPRTAVIWFRQRTPEQFYAAVENIVVVPQHVYGAAPRGSLKTSDLLRKPVGSGRFRFVRWDAGSRLEVVADTGNYRGRAKLDRVVWTLTPDLPSAVARLAAGEADFLETVPPDDVARVEGAQGYAVVPYPNRQHAFMGMNLRASPGSAAPHPVFGDVRVRRAFSMAVDREAMLRNVFGDRGQRSFGPFPRATSVADTTLALPPYDTAAAAALLDSAGWLRGPDGMRRKGGRPLAFSLLTPQSSKPRMSYAVLLQEQLRRIGARVDIETLDFPSFTARRSSRRFDAVLQGWNADPGPGGIAQRWSSANIDQGPNDEAYQNPRFDAYLDSASASFDPATMQRHMRTAFEQLIADAPAIWLYEPLTLAGIHQRIRPRPMPARGWWTHIADWHIPANARIARDGVGLATRSP